MRYKMYALVMIITLFFMNCASDSNKKNNDFLWGVACASYQSEGFKDADGKGLSNWDVYTNELEVTKAFTGNKQTGNDAIKFYDRNVYLEDIKLMKDLGVNAFRFSISWARILPEGMGKVNDKGVAHYMQFVDDLLANGIEPMVTLYHWDLPQALTEKGGWNNPEIVNWYANYANTIFNAFGKKVKYYITFNEPSIDNFFIEPMIDNMKQKKIPFAFSNEQLAARVMPIHHLMLAHAKTVLNYKALNLGGKIGITLSLLLTAPKDAMNKKDIAVAALENTIFNTWFLDASQLGTYPKEALDVYKKYYPKMNITEADMALIKSAKSDFLGINYYGVSYINYNDKRPFNIEIAPNPDSNQMFNGAVRPKAFYDLLLSLKQNYNNPEIYITENGAGFGVKDEQFVTDTVRDVLRSQYVKDHIKAALDAKKEGVNLKGYMLWSLCDNFEWVFGYDRRFGIVHVDFNTNKRSPKQSYYDYQKIIQAETSK